MTHPEDEPYRETPEADAAEQAAIADPAWTDEDEQDGSEPAPIEAPEWDAQEQRQVVAMDDDYR
jgi:hypothetical protein